MYIYDAANQPPKISIVFWSYILDYKFLVFPVLSIILSSLRNALYKL